MKHCAQFEILISAYNDNELNASDRQLLEEHIQSCPDCFNLLVLYRGMSVSITDELVAPPQMLLNNVMEIIEATEETKQRNKSSDRERYNTHKKIHKTLNKYIPIAACLALALLAIPFFLNNRSAEPLNEVALQAAPIPATDFRASGYDLADDLVVTEEMEFDYFVTEEAEELLADDVLAVNNAGAEYGTRVGAGGQEGLPTTDAPFILDFNYILEEYYAYIEIDFDPPPTIFRKAYHGNFYLIRSSDVTELLTLMEEFVLLFLHGNMDAEFALVLFTD